jgi:DNA-binding response OmpR family regulator
MSVKLLVIDDDSAVTDLLSLLLRSHGFEVGATNNSTEGLSMIRDNSPDVVILDLMMPDMDGWQICKAVREFSQVPIIILSALNDPSMIASVLDDQADSKPRVDCSYQSLGESDGFRAFKRLNH